MQPISKQKRGNATIGNLAESRPGNSGISSALPIPKNQRRSCNTMKVISARKVPYLAVRVGMSNRRKMAIIPSRGQDVAPREQ
jgi:hypothetical protein